MVTRKFKYAISVLLTFFALLVSGNALAINLFGETTTHDPSTIVRDGDTYWTFGTGDGNVGMVSRRSNDLINWTVGSTVFSPGTWPSWINQRVPNFDGNFWAPDLIQMNGRYYIYYSAFSTSNPPTSAIGVAVTDSLNNPNWQDLGMVVSTQTEGTMNGQPVNAIDPGLYRDANGNAWMIYGSHYAGIFIVQINPNTGLRMNSNRYNAIGNNGNWHEFEGAQVAYLNGFYYAFVNLGECCAGDQSTYYIVVGRSNSPTGPFLDQGGRSLWDYGGTTVLSTSGRYIGPGHFGYLNNNGQHLASIHYYDGNTSNGWPSRLDILQMNFSNGWPSFTRNFTLQSGSSSSSSGGSSSGGSVSVSLGASAGNGSVALDWSVSGSISAQEVYRDTDSNPSGRVRIATLGSGDRGYTATGLSNGTTYYFWIKARRSGDNTWVNSNVASATPSGGGSSSSSSGGAVSNGIYRITPVHSGKALDVENCGTANGTNVRQWSWLNNDCQRWNVTQVDGQYFRISPVNTPTRSLDVDSLSTNDGANIMLWDYWGGDNQQFRFESAGSDRWRIISRLSGKCLDIDGISTADGANLMQWTCIGANENQQFLLQSQ